MTTITVTRAAGTTLLAVSLMVPLTVAGLSAALPLIAAHFSDTANIDFLSRLMLVAPSLVIAVTSPAMGYIVDRFGRTKLLLGSVALYGIVGGAGFFAESIEVLIALRVLIGVAAAGVNTAVTTLAGDYFTGPERQNFMGFRGGLSNLTNIGFNVCSGLLAAVSWRMPFLMYTAVLLLVPFIALLMPEPARVATGQSTATETKTPWPIMFLVASYAAAFLYNTVFYLVPTQLPFLLHALGIDDPRMSGVGLAAVSFGLAVGSAIYAPVRRWAGTPEAVFSAASLIMGVGMIAAWHFETALPVMLALTGGGVGVGMVFVNFSLWIIDRVPVEIRGRAVGGLMTSTFLGHFAAPFWSQPVAEAFGIGSIYLVGGVITLVLGAAYLVYRPKPR